MARDKWKHGWRKRKLERVREATERLQGHGVTLMMDDIAEAFGVPRQPDESDEQLNLRIQKARGVSLAGMGK